MANRFTDSRKWDDPWFRKLPCKHKIFWMFILDKCNHAGIWKVDFESAEFHIGEKITSEEILPIMNGRITVLKDKWFISKFIEFQYGVSIDELNEDNRVHKSVLDILKKEGACKGLKRGVEGCKDKNKDKDKDFIESIRLDPLYKHINIDNELLKMDRWLEKPCNKGRRKTPTFITNWLNKIEVTIPAVKKPGMNAL